MTCGKTAGGYEQSRSARRRGIPLLDGPAAGGGTLAGAASAILVITPARPADAGAYDCIVTTACGESLTSAAEALTVTPPLCLEDADHSGAVNFSDITAVLSQFGGLCS